LAQRRARQTAQHPVHLLVVARLAHVLSDGGGGQVFERNLEQPESLVVGNHHFADVIGVVIGQSDGVGIAIENIGFGVHSPSESKT